jgi:hypothetical protein
MILVCIIGAGKAEVDNIAIRSKPYTPDEVTNNVRVLGLWQRHMKVQDRSQTIHFVFYDSYFAFLGKP